MTKKKKQRKKWQNFENSVLYFLRTKIHFFAVFSDKATD